MSQDSEDISFGSNISCMRQYSSSALTVLPLTHSASVRLRSTLFTVQHDYVGFGLFFL